MSKKKAEEAIVPEVTDGVMANCIALDTSGQVIFRQEQEMLDRIAAMEQKVSRWVDGLQDLNRRVSGVGGFVNGLDVNVTAMKCELIRWMERHDNLRDEVVRLQKSVRDTNLAEQVDKLRRKQDDVDMLKAEMAVMEGEGKDCEREQQG